MSSFGSRIFNKVQSIEQEVKDLYLKFSVSNPTAATATLDLTNDITLTASVQGTGRNTNTFTTQVAASAANPTDTVLAAFTGTSAAITCTITPNNGTNNPANAAATGTLDLTSDITLTSVAVGAGRNTNTFTLEVAAAAANPTDTILADFTGTAAAIVCTITPNDGTNNGATPVDLTTAELTELINTGAVVGKNVTVTDASSLRNDQTASGGDATALADAGEGDGVVATFTGGTTVTVTLTTAELRELITTGAVVGKNVTVTDASSLRALQTATGGGATDLADAGEGDGVVGTFSGGDGNLPAIIYGPGFASITRNDVGDYTITLQDKYYSLKHLRATVIDTTAVDARVQIHTNDIQNKTVRILVLTGATPTDLTDGTQFVLQMDVKNTNQPY